MKLAWAALLLDLLVAPTVAAATSSDLESLTARVTAEGHQIAELERKADTLLTPPAPIVPPQSPVALYLGGGGELPRLDEHKRLDARHLMLMELERAGVTEVDYDEGAEVHRFAPPWQKAGFVVAPVEVLIAIRAAATPPLEGVELDLRIPTEARGTHYVTVIHELDGRVLVTDIAATGVEPNSQPPSSHDDATLRKRFGIGRLDTGAAKWSAKERESLEHSLSLLSAKELACIRDLELRREERPTRVLPVKGACGLSVVEWNARWLELNDCAFRNDDIVFVGNPKAPERGSVRLILHELGHAVATYPVFDFNRALQQLADGGKKIGEKYLALRAGASPADQRSLDEIIAPLPKLSERLQVLAKRVSSAHPAGPAVTAFSKLPGASAGITSYGVQSPAEAFAEAFSLFHADPDALRRVSPQVLEFFRRGDHLRAGE